MADPREPLGRLVRETWLAWARLEPAPKPSWLLPWELLDDGQREVDMRIGEAIAASVREQVASDIEASIVAPPDRYQRVCRCLEGEKCHPHACHDAMNRVTAQCAAVQDETGEEVWPVVRSGSLWDELDPLIRRDAAAIARNGPWPLAPGEEEVSGDG